MEQNLTSLGFLNPTLYAYGNKSGVFNDIKSGNNNCCTYTGTNPSDAQCCPSGFSAGTGWDPITGLGSIFYPNLAGIFSVNASYVNSEPTVEPKPFWGIPASIMAIIIVVIVLLAICYPVGAYCRRKCLPKSTPPVDVYEDYRDCRALYRGCCSALCPCCEQPPAPTPRWARRRSSLQAPLIAEERR